MNIFSSVFSRTSHRPAAISRPETASRRRSPRPRLPVLMLAAAGVLATTASSCRMVVSERGLGRVDKALQLRKAPSLRSWPEISGESALSLKIVEVRTGLLLSHWDSISVNTRTSRDDTTTFDVKFSGQGGFISSAVPVSTDGYFLTAAHCVDNDDLTLVTLNQDFRLVKVKARVVWCGDAKNGPDLAVIHAKVRPPMPFQLAGANELIENVPVAATGWSGIVHENPTGATAAGRILSVSPLQADKSSGAVWRVVGHDVPLNFGDSGGPLVLKDGRLAGINSCIGVTMGGFLKTTLGMTGSTDRPLTGYTGEACIPSPS